jgi:hypothetical protein
MKHESLKIKSFTVKEDKGFRVRVESWEVISPKGLHTFDFIQESLDLDGKVQYSSTYNFFMTKDEIKTLCEGLLSE